MAKTILRQYYYLHKKERKNLIMNCSTANFIKGVTAGLIVGAAVTMLTDPISDRQRSRLMRRTEGVFKNMGGMIDAAIGMFH